MRKSIVFIFLFFFSASGYAYTLSGKLVDKKTNKPIVNASVGIKELKLTASTDNNGEFYFQGLAPGFYNLQFSHAFYGIIKKEIRLKRNFNIELKLEEKRYKLNRLDYNYKWRQARFGAQQITYQDISDFPMRGVGDSLHLLQTLPGVGGASSFSTVPIIRGGNPVYDKMYIDEIPIDIPYHYILAMVPVLSAINQEAIAEVNLIKGLSPMYYDDNLGNVLEIKTKTPDQTGVEGKIVSDAFLPLIPTIAISAIPGQNISTLAVVRRTTFDLLTDYDDKDGYIQDYYGKVIYNLFDNHRISFIALGADDKYQRDEIATRSQFSMQALKWDYLISKHLLLKTMLSHYGIDNYFKNNEDYNDAMVEGLSIQVNPAQYRWFQILNFTEKNYFIKAGYEIIKHKNGISGNAEISDIASANALEEMDDIGDLERKIEGTSYAFFTENGINYNNMWINLGGRYKYYGPLETKSFSGRGEWGAYINKNNVIYAGFGKYHAHPDLFYYLQIDEPDFKDCKAYNSNLGIKSKIIPEISSQFELFYSKYENFPTASSGFVDAADYLKKIIQVSPYANEESGKTYGMEVFLKAQKENYQGWISYTYSVSKRSANGEEFYSDYDQSHLLRIVIAVTFGKWTPAFIWHYYSAQPYTPVLSSTYNGDEYDPNYADYNSARCAPNHRLDFKISYQSDNSWRFYAEVWNLYLNQNNYLYERYDTDDPISEDNPGKTADYIPIFLWAGIELCF